MGPRILSFRIGNRPGPHFLLDGKRRTSLYPSVAEEEGIELREEFEAR